MIVIPSFRGVLSSGATSLPKIENLIAFWNLENASNTDPIPASYGAYTLNMYNGYSSVPGVIDDGVLFADSNEGMWTNEQLWNILTSPTSFTVSFWLKMNSVSSAFTLMGNAFGSMGFHFDYINDDSFYGYPNYGITMNMSTFDGPYNWQRTFTKELASANVWYHVVGTYNLPSTTMKLYVNGVLKDTNSSAVIGENSEPGWHGFALNGSVLPDSKEYGNTEFYDAVGFWNTDLSPTDIITLYNSGVGLQFQ